MQRSDIFVAPLLAVSSSIEGGGLYDCCTLLRPFEKVDARMGYDSLSETKSPSICISCGAVLCLYCSVSENGEFWRCAMCKSLNPSTFYPIKADHTMVLLNEEQRESISRMKQPGSDSALKHMMEFRSSFCEYREDLSSQSLSSGLLQSRRFGFDYHLFAIDCSSIGLDEQLRVDRAGLWLLRLLEEACTKLSGQRVQLGFLLFRGDGSSCAINILRLSGSGSGRGLGSGSGIMEMDSVSGKAEPEDASCTTTARFCDHGIRIGAYTSLASIVHKHFGSIKAAILTAAGVGTTPPSRSGTTGPAKVAMSSLIAIAGRFSSLFSALSEPGFRHRQVRMSVILSGPLSIGNISTERGDDIGEYRTLGQTAFEQQHVSMDILLYVNPRPRGFIGRSNTISADVSFADRLEALVEPSGGISLFLPAAVDDGDAAEAVRLSFLQACATAEPGFIRGDIASEAMLEIRTCGRLSVRRVTGPVQQKSAAGSQYSASLRSRFRPDTAVFLQLERSQGQDKGKDGFPTLTHASRESVMEESDTNGASINRSRYAYIQIIVRFDVCGQESASADGPSQFAVYRPVDTDDITGKGLLAGTLQPIRVVNYASSQSEAQEESKGQSGSSVAQRVTRVWTQRIELTSDVNEYLECVDEKLLAIVLCKGIVASYHEQSRRTFGGAKKISLDEEGKYLHKSIRASALTAVDELVRNIANLYISNRRKTVSMCRILYGLREGPLLDGPAMQSIDAYMLRSRFLRHFSYRQSLSSLVPDLLAYPAILFESEAQADFDIDGDEGLHPEIFPVPVSVDDLSYWGLSVSLPPESLSVLPDAVTVADCGDVIVVRLGPIAADRMKTESQDDSNGSGAIICDPLSALASAIVKRAQSLARQRYPASEVRVLSSILPPPTTTSKHRSACGPATSGQDRLLYSRLSPSHMDSKEGVLETYGKWGLRKMPIVSVDSMIRTGSGLTSSTNNSAEDVSSGQVVLTTTEENRAARRSLCDLFDLSEDNIHINVIGRSPITDQVFFHKYILLALPAVASSELLSLSTPMLQTPFKSSKSSMSRLTRSNSNISAAQVMERDPINPTDDFAASNDGLMDFFDAPTDKNLRGQWNVRDGSSKDLTGLCSTPPASGSEKSKFLVQSLLERMMTISPLKASSLQINTVDDTNTIVFDDDTRSLV